VPTACDPPPPFAHVRADEADLDRLRLLDDELRQDVPGTDGWRWDEDGFREETFQPAFDPALYLVAVDGGEYVGIVRVWMNPRGPRLGFVGVRRSQRQHGLGRALVAAVFAELHSRGIAEVTTEIDDENVASRALLEGMGARPVGATLELVRLGS
jgi:RimJ/RimL family protein N-acetyltransferase